MADKIAYKDGEPCSHAGCLNHVTHPCEGCGRIAGRKMADKISVDELKIFVGTGLKCKEGNLYQEYIVAGLIDDRPFLAKPGIPDNQQTKFTVDIDTIKPMVRPLSDLSQEIKEDLDIYNGRVLNPTDLYIFHAAKDKSLSYKDMLYLSNMHYDVFNWLNRTGEDGTPLAVELEG